MNGLTLRINRGGVNKCKNTMAFLPVNITDYIENSDDVYNDLFKMFNTATTTNHQLQIINKIIMHRKEKSCEFIEFLALVFLHAEAKHPLKCLILRYITKNNHLQQPFTDILASKLLGLMSNVPSHYKEYVDVVRKIAMCIENFNAGIAAVRKVEKELADYLKTCLEFCVKILSENKSLSAPEKNEIFNLAHLTLRLLLHIVQKANADTSGKLIPMCCAIRLCIEWLMFDDEVPMDTKSVSGILYLSMHILEYGPDSWQDILNPSFNNTSLCLLLQGTASQLCLYSAVGTVVTVERLQNHNVNGLPAIIVLLNNILDISDRNSSESTLVLGVSRTVLQLSKMLVKLTDKATAMCIVESLLLFSWSHLEHHMDSVRHLTSQTLSVVVKYCAKLDRQGDDTAITKLQTALNSIDRSRKSYYVCLTCLVSEFDSIRVLETWPTIIQDVLNALNYQHIQACATTTLQTLLQKHNKCCNVEQLYNVWVYTILKYIEGRTLDCSVLNVLDNILTDLVKINEQLLDYITPHIQQTEDTSTTQWDLKCILMLLSVLRKSGVTLDLESSYGDDRWKGIISYKVLQQAAIDAVDETRILSLSVVVDSVKTTEELSAGDLSFILYYMKYNINAQAPHLRQLTLSIMKRFIKRLEGSYRAIVRQNEDNVNDHKVDNYLRFIEELRHQCFDSLVPGANYSRRCVALQLLTWIHDINFDGYDSTWKPEYIEKLLLHLEDSYENNKALALEVLYHCPVEMLKLNTYCISLDIKDIFVQASSLKPTDCVSAAYKLDLLVYKLPDYIMDGEHCTARDPAIFTLLRKLLTRVQEELAICEQSVVLAARNGPMYGVLHCIRHILEYVDPVGKSSDIQWTSLISDIISCCMAVNAAVSSVVNNTSPEGHLPMDISGLVVTDHGNSGGVELDDGRQVTSQMVLLCAWRSVKECSLTLGTISYRMSLREDQIRSVGAHFWTVLAVTKHRGAFEQAYVGFTKLLLRVWRYEPELRKLPESWLSELIHIIASGDSKGSLSSTRRSAGLPFMIQALLTTELQVYGKPRSLHSSISSLMTVGRSASCLESRAHALNILRALFRNTSLDDSVAPYVGDGIILAIQGFEGDSWAERNSSTLLFSALMVRVFGVSRTRDVHALNVRNKMTGRIFFLKYPQLYDFMLKKLEDVSNNKDTQLLRPSLYPVLLLLARLYPSSLEGTVSNLKLVAFIPHVLSCASSSVLKTRQLAATAMLPLVEPELFVRHVVATFREVGPRAPRNLCHGALLQLSALLGSSPDHLTSHDTQVLEGCLDHTIWILEQAFVSAPCYLIIDEYLKVINLMVWRFPNTLKEETIQKIISYLDKLIFNTDPPKITIGRDLCLSNAIYVLFLLLNKRIVDSCQLILKGLKHSSYEIVLSTLNYLLVLHNNFEENKCIFLEHLTVTANKNILYTLKSYDNYVSFLCKLLKNNYLECQQKSLKILTLEGGTQKFIIEAKIGEEISDEKIIKNLFDCIANEHEHLTHIYLESLLDLVNSKIENSNLNGNVLLDVIRVVFDYSSSDNNEYIRSVVVTFIEKNIGRLLDVDMSVLNEEEIFELEATVWCTVITLVEDDELYLRRRVSAAVTSLHGVTSRVPSAYADLIVDSIGTSKRATGLLLVVALVDFKSAVLTDDGNDECRVFDQNERYNIYLEETIWTNKCAEKMISINKDKTLADCVSSVIDNPIYISTINKLCDQNIVMFKKVMAGEELLRRNDAINPKIELFIKSCLC